VRAAARHATKCAIARPAALLDLQGSVLKVDFHSHSADDPADRIPYTTEALIDRAGALGFDALAITLHDRQLDVEPLADYARERGVLLIPGVERTIEGKHVLLLNFTRATDHVRTFEDLGRLRRREPGGLVIAPHPFFPGPTCLGPMLERHADLFDAVEYSGMFTSVINFNDAGQEWARDMRKPMVGNGDVHRLVQLGPTHSLVHADRNVQAICEAVKRGRVTVQARPLSAITAARIVADLIVADFFIGRRPAVPDTRLATS
jgi:predicted metal-dependent phosphoesterase TrpH